MTIPVVWYTNAEGADQRGYWDQGWLEDLFAARLWRTPRPYSFQHLSGFSELPEGSGAIVVIPGRWHVDAVAEVSASISSLPWVLLVVTGDEEDLFPLQELDHPNLRAWTQTPRPSRDVGPRSVIGDFYPPGAPARIAAIGDRERDLDFFFAGQLNTANREHLERVLRDLPNPAQSIWTSTFGAGLEYQEYLETMARAKVVPCPSGPFTPDTFRLYEALEAGCVPVVEARSPNYGEDGYWAKVCGRVPWPIVESWDEFPQLLEELLADWPARAATCSAEWQGYKRGLVYAFESDIKELSGIDPPEAGFGEKVTVLIPTSPAPSNPDTSVIEEVVASVVDRLPACEVIVMLDGLHADLSDRSDSYAEYRRRVTWLCEHQWAALPVEFSRHHHQGAMTREALGYVQTPMVLFVEHDTPLLGEIPFEDLVRVIEDDRADLIRLHHEASVLPDHEHMMLDVDAQEVSGVPLKRTVQWSQRPHLASTAFYRRITREYFGLDSRTMIEEVMHGVVHTHWREYGVAGWDRFRLWMYHPEGDIKRSGHLDARGDDAHVPMSFAYDVGQPFGAPAPT